MNTVEQQWRHRVDSTEPPALDLHSTAMRISQLLSHSEQQRLQLRDSLPICQALFGLAQALGANATSDWSYSDLGRAIARRVSSPKFLSTKDTGPIEKALGNLVSLLKATQEQKQTDLLECELDAGCFQGSLAVQARGLDLSLSPAAADVLQRFASMLNPATKHSSNRSSLGEYQLEATQFEPQALRELANAKLIKERRRSSCLGQDFVSLSDTGVVLILTTIQGLELSPRRDQPQDRISALLTANRRIGFEDAEFYSQQIWLKLATADAPAASQLECAIARARELAKRDIHVAEFALAKVHANCDVFEGVLHYIGYARRYEQARSLRESLDDLMLVAPRDRMSSQKLTSAISTIWKELGGDDLSGKELRWWARMRETLGKEDRHDLLRLLYAISHKHATLADYSQAAQQASTEDVGAVLHYMELRRIRGQGSRTSRILHALDRGFQDLGAAGQHNPQS